MVRLGLAVFAVLLVACGGHGAGDTGAGTDATIVDDTADQGDAGVDVVGSDEPAPGDVVDACVRGTMGEGASCHSACDCAAGLACEFRAMGCLAGGTCGHPATGCDAGGATQACGCEGTTLTSCATQFEQPYQSLGACAMMY